MAGICTLSSDEEAAVSPSTALVIFVKTPGASPVKTRLAREIGVEKAEEFYRMSLRATEARAKVLQSRIDGLRVYWAVAEKDCNQSSIWSAFPSLYQGEGDLGDRLSEIYRQSLEAHASVCFIGADSPHISTAQLANCIQKTESGQRDGFQLGRTSDGGFYFFGGGIRIPEEVWTGIEYSTERTAEELSRRLNAYGSVGSLPADFDVDTYEDLVRLSELKFRDDLLPEQKEMIAWAGELHRCKGGVRG
jgi:glycosyltransferase A (GT-A) superfamily protein (DUF2064 family)